MIASQAQAVGELEYRQIIDFVYRQSGIVLGEGKEYLIEARLMPIVKARGLRGVTDLCARLRGDGQGELGLAIIDAMATHETLFFRDIGVFEALRTTIIPRLMAQKPPARKFRVWSAASSSGQEPYSLAILLSEMNLGPLDVDIFATDLCPQTVARARSGHYSTVEVNRGMPVQKLIKYFTRQGPEWVLKPEIRALVRFECFDLRQKMDSMGPFDLVLCRNVLIYFDVPTKKRILGGIRSALFPGGYLALGTAETTLCLDEIYKRHPIGNTAFYQAP
jgi:chemotaxis protein methyltransferase CheR